MLVSFSIYIYTKQHIHFFITNIVNWCKYDSNINSGQISLSNYNFYVSAALILLFFPLEKTFDKTGLFYSCHHYQISWFNILGRVKFGMVINFWMGGWAWLCFLLITDLCSYLQQIILLLIYIQYKSTIAHQTKMLEIKYFSLAKKYVPCV